MVNGEVFQSLVAHSATAELTQEPRLLVYVKPGRGVTVPHFPAG